LKWYIKIYNKKEELRAELGNYRPFPWKRAVPLSGAILSQARKYKQYSHYDFFPLNQHPADHIKPFQGYGFPEIITDDFFIIKQRGGFF
jgi:hypothetical protein